MKTGVEPCDLQAVDAHFAESYRELRKMARLRLRVNRPDAVIDTTALVHESYLRLAAAGRSELKDRPHFLAYAGTAMRSVVVDLVRKRRANRHGGSAVQVTLNTGLQGGIAAVDEEILGVHEALNDLAKLDGRMARIVEMRYFAGMTETEIGEALGIGERTVRREWEKARICLSQAFGAELPERGEGF